MSRGFDKEAINNQLLFGLTLEERVGGDLAVIHDRAKPHHTCTLHGATIGWGSLASGVPYTDLTAATPDWIDCPAVDTADLDFQAGDFSLAAWVYPHLIGASARTIFCRGNWQVDGWEFSIGTGQLVFIATYQAGFDQQSYTALNSILVNNWYLVGAVRNLQNIRLYINGVDRPDTVAAHTDPASCNRELHIGVYDTHGYRFDGLIALPRIWGRKLSAEEMHEIWNRERVLFNV